MTWKPTTQPLTTATAWTGQDDTAVVLSDKRVLVAGGADATGKALDKSAFYAVGDDKWTETLPLVQARRLHTMTFLKDDVVLVAGGITGTPTFPSEGSKKSELYVPKDKKWVATKGDLKVGRWGHSAVVLPNGKVLVTGGRTRRSAQSHRALASAEIYDPTEGTWSDAADMNDARSGHQSILLSNNLVLVIGGSTPVSGTADAALAYCELYDATKNTWTPTGSLAVPRTQHQAVELSDNTVLVVGGHSPGGPGDGTFNPFSLRSTEIYTPGAGWTPGPDLPYGRSGHRAVALADKEALVAGGTDGATADIGYPNALHLKAGSWQPAGQLTAGRFGFAAAAVDGKVVVIGGVTRSGPAAAEPGKDELTATAEVWSPA
jgi:N-acetylneuraminic acid mutarotase